MPDDATQRDSLYQATKLAGYMPQNHVELQPSMQPEPRAGLRHQVYLQPMSMGPARPGPSSRWREHSIMLGLWMLVLVGVGALAMRFMEDTNPTEEKLVVRSQQVQKALPAAINVEAADLFEEDAREI